MRCAPQTGSIAQVRVPDDIGRRYGAVSGDRNPIHLHKLSAKAFGFPSAIAHGMWLKARTLATLEGRLPDAYTVEVAFKLPVLLPSSVAISGEHAGDEWTLDVRDARSGKPHLAGTVTVSGVGGPAEAVSAKVRRAGERTRRRRRRQRTVREEGRARRRPRRRRHPRRRPRRRRAAKKAAPAKKSAAGPAELITSFRRRRRRRAAGPRRQRRKTSHRQGQQSSLSPQLAGYPKVNRPDPGKA